MRGTRSTLARLRWSALLLLGLSAGCDRPPAVPATAASTSGGATASPAAAAPWFVESAAASGLRFEHDSGHRERFLFPECVCGGAALFDMDGDGDLDAYLVQGGGVLEPREQRPGNRLFRNRGDGTFEDATAGSGADDRGYGMGVATGDYDNDGDVDLYVTNLEANVLLRNDGGGRFTDVSEAAGVADRLWGISAAFLDHDADGDLDLFVANYLNWSPGVERDCYSYGELDYCEPLGYESPARDSLYRNEGDGTFTDVSLEAGLGRAFGNGMGVVCGDLDGDGWTDVFVSNDLMNNQLWRNQGDGTFRDEAMLAGVAVDRYGQAKAGMGVDAIDIDDDSDLDLLVVNLNTQTDSLFRNDGGFFSDQTAAVGLAPVSRPFTRFGVGWVDFDNDGWLDLFQANGRVRILDRRWSDDPYAEPNMLCAGGPDGRLREILPRGGTAAPLIATSRSAAFGDVDGDGRVDVLVANRDGAAHLLRNVVEDGGNWLMLRVVDEHGRDALGANVTMTIGPRRVRREVRTTHSYAAASDPRIHVGLGEARSAVDIDVRWPDGATERFGSASANQIVVLRRGEGAG